MRKVRALSVALVVAGCIAAASAAPASASVCGVLGWINGAASKVCGVVTHGDKLLAGGKKLASGHLGGAVKAVLGGGDGGGGSKAAALVTLAAVGTWVLGGAKTALTDTAKVLGDTTDPRLGTTWFSATYWRMAGIAAVLTLPFLFAAAVQALLRSDLSLLARAAFGYLPLSLLAVGIAAPLTTLLLAACDQMSTIVSSAAGHAGTHFLSRMTAVAGGLAAVSHSPFLIFLVALLTAAAAITLWIELLVREAAVYIVVLMLPLAFAALAWPARRVWAIRAVEMLVALILSKFAIVAVLALGGAALSTAGPSGMLAGLVLVVLAAFAPWALVRLLPLAELASGAAGQLRGGLSQANRALGGADEALGRAENWAGTVTSGMRRLAEAHGTGLDADAEPVPAGVLPDVGVDPQAQAEDGIDRPRQSPDPAPEPPPEPPPDRRLTSQPSKPPDSRPAASEPNGAARSPRARGAGEHRSSGPRLPPGSRCGTRPLTRTRASRPTRARPALIAAGRRGSRSAPAWR